MIICVLLYKLLYNKLIYDPKRCALKPMQQDTGRQTPAKEVSQYVLSRRFLHNIQHARIRQWFVMGLLDRLGDPEWV